MMDQSEAWGRVAKRYDELFVDPYADEAGNPVLKYLARLPNAKKLTVGDLGCGTGPLLPRLAKQFKTVIAVDFSAGMLREARGRCKSLKNIRYEQLAFNQLSELADSLDVIVSMNSLVNADVRVLDNALAGFRTALKKGGVALGIVPSLEGLHYHVMHLIDLGIARGMELEHAYAFAARKAELHGYQLATATFSFDNIHQHLWQRDEVAYRLKKAGHSAVQVRKAYLPWDQFAEARALNKYPPSWDWAFLAKK
jgi:SAM-dependent methyltransferase